MLIFSDNDFVNDYKPSEIIIITFCRMVQVNGHIIFCNNKILNKKTIVKKKKSVFLKFFKLRRLDGQQLTHRINLRLHF